MVARKKSKISQSESLKVSKEIELNSSLSNLLGMFLLEYQ